MTSSVAVSAIAIIIGLMIVVLVVVRRRSGSEAAPVIQNHDHAGWADDDAVAVIVERDPDVQWPKMLGQAPGPLDDNARLRLINDLALVRAPWCVAILRQACNEERDPMLRDAAGTALELCTDANDARSSTSS